MLNKREHTVYTRCPSRRYHFSEKRRSRFTGLLTMAARNLKSLSKSELKELIDSVDVVLSDCDGVLWREADVVPGSPETVEKFKKAGKKFFYVTNNNDKTRKELAEKCKGLGYNAAPEEIVCTSYLAAMYLKNKGFDKKVYLIGNGGISKELEAVGISHTGLGEDIMKGSPLDLIENFKPDPDVGAVIVGFDTHFSYPKLVKGATYAANPKVYFIGANPDTERPSPNPNRFPGTGCLTKAIEAASGRQAVVLGKPEPYVSEHLIKTYGLDPARTLMIGDNCMTDILLGKRCGFKTLLVLSGIGKKSDFIAHGQNGYREEKKIIPNYYTDTLSDVFKLLES